MSKGSVFIISSAVIILVSFGAFCYLMTIVNPNPLKTTTEDTRRISSVDTLYVNDLFLPSDNVDYGLDKVPEKYVEFLNVTGKRLPKIAYAHGPSGDVDGAVVPPVWPRMNFTEIVKNCTRNSSNLNAYFPRKGHRRSVRDKIESNGDTNGPSTRILKIVDGKGIQRIEINIGTNSVGKKARKYRSSGNKTKSQSFRGEYDYYFKANDTIVLSVIGDSVLLSGAKLIENVNTDDDIDIDNATANSKIQLNMKINVNNTLDENHNTASRMFDLLKMDSDNENKSGINIGTVANEELFANSSIISDGIFNKGANDYIESVKGNSSTVDLLSLEDPLRGALIKEHDPFVLAENNSFIDHLVR